VTGGSLREEFADSLWWLAILRLVAAVMMLAVFGSPLNTLQGDILAAMFAIILAMTIPSVMPLMRRRRAGWALFFLTMPVQAGGVVASLAVGASPMLIGALVGAALAGWALLEVRDCFR
jgi:hypothetical protein